MINGKILVVMAHPDDESFGPGGTIAKYAACGVEIHLLCATKGEAGMWSDVRPKKGGVGAVREKEHKRAVEILGIKELKHLGYVDGTLANKDVEELVNKVRVKIEAFKPDVILAFDIFGVSGHMDHITMTMVATKAFEASPAVKKLYYWAVTEKLAGEMWQRHGRKLWSRKDGEMTTRVETKQFLAVKMAAAAQHRTQKRDMERMAPFWEKYGHTEHFVLAQSRVKTALPETDFFSGIN